jgi:hypothetical protein
MVIGQIQIQFHDKILRIWIWQNGAVTSPADPDQQHCILLLGLKVVSSEN